MGSSDKAHVSTFDVAHQNLNVRMSTCLIKAFNKKAESHEHVIALYFTFYNFVRMHKTLRCSSAMAACLTGKLWSMEDFIALIDARRCSEGMRVALPDKS